MFLFNVSQDHSMRPLNQLNSPFVPSLSQIRLGGTRKLVIGSYQEMEEWKNGNSRISINQKYI